MTHDNCATSVDIELQLLLEIVASLQVYSLLYDTDKYTTVL